MRDIVAERRLVRFWGVVRRGMPPVGRYKRYAVSIAPVLGAIWLSTAAYLLLVPKSYSSEFALILPGSGVGSTLNVESIGQAQSSASSAFSSPTLSPTENYKQLLTADVTLRAAAAIAREDGDRFPSPAVKLVDQTNLIRVTISAGDAGQAKRRAEAVRTAFLRQLDTLRADEADMRERSDLRHLQQLSDKVRAAQRRLIAFQASHGLATLDQFNNRIAAVDTLKDKERELRLQRRQAAGSAGRLAASLHSSPGGADIAMRLRGDPVFQQLAERYAASNAQASELAGTLGPQHATMAQAEAERTELRAALVRRGRELTGLGEKAILSRVDIQLADGRSNLMQAMSVQDAEAAGTDRALAEIRGDLARAQAQSPRLIEEASELADLQRDHRVAEAVFSSALARVDTNKQDPFASYPLVQTLAAPSLPKAPSSPSLTIAILGAIAASILTLLAFGLLWLRQPILDKLLPKG
ncbi:MAG: hypothetical protein U0S50_03225 [Sphingopyxis sp.]|uniref:GumC family protein n=1 Tax=Sphingopyxis sp. TaxID=1908224 RepID=UPI002ABB4EA8|nr:hypothetical protein [Sphingopyxis sp.]MDZ3830815.1 hypothetical protein [Sphingopyxis sp.]